METSKPTFAEMIRESEVPVLVDFYADWCGPCKMMPPILSEFSEKNKGKVKVVKVDVDRNPSASAAYNVRAVPTLIMFHKGEIIWRNAGVVPASQLSAILAEYQSRQA